MRCDPSRISIGYGVCSFIPTHTHTLSLFLSDNFRRPIIDNRMGGLRGAFEAELFLPFSYMQGYRASILQRGEEGETESKWLTMRERICRNLKTSRVSSKFIWISSKPVLCNMTDTINWEIWNWGWGVTYGHFYTYHIIQENISLIRLHSSWTIFKTSDHFDGYLSTLLRKR